MRILQISKYYPPVRGGLEHVVYDLCTGLRDAGHDCDVLCANKARRSRIETHGGSTVMRCSRWGRFASTPLTPRMLYQYPRIADAYDVVHIHLPNPMANLAALTKRAKAKLVLHWHSDIVRQKGLLRLYAPILRKLLERADAIIATSQNYLEGSAWLAPYRHKTHIVPIGIETAYLTAEEGQVDRIRSRFPRRPIVLALGRLTYYKGFEYLIRAARDIDAWILIGGKGELSDQLQRSIEAYGVGDRVVLLGAVPSTELGAYYAACDIFCLPSDRKSEAFGVVQLEAMACAKPVVSTRIPGSGVSAVNEHMVSGLTVEPADPKQLAAAVNHLLADSDLAARLGEGGKRRRQERFSKKKMIDDTLGVYAQALDHIMPVAAE